MVLDFKMWLRHVISIFDFEKEEQIVEYYWIKHKHEFRPKKEEVKKGLGVQNSPTANFEPPFSPNY